MSRADPPSFTAADLWRFAGYLAGEATVEQAAKWSGRLASEGGAMLEALCRRVGNRGRVMLDQATLPGFERHMRPHTVMVADIQREVAAFFRIPVAEMVSQRRARDVARPRQVAMYLAKKLTPKSLPDIGRRFGGRDHSTVIHAVKQVERLIGADVAIAEAVRELEGRL